MAIVNTIPFSIYDVIYSSSIIMKDSLAGGVS